MPCIANPSAQIFLLKVEPKDRLPPVLEHILTHSKVLLVGNYLSNADLPKLRPMMMEGKVLSRHSNLQNMAHAKGIFFNRDSSLCDQVFHLLKYDLPKELQKAAGRRKS